MAVSAAAILTGWAPLVFIGAAIGGVAFGPGFRGGLQTVLGPTPPERRSGVLSLLYIVSYLGFGLPAIGAGLVVVASGDLPATTLGYCGVMVLLSLVALAALLHTRTKEAR